MSNKYRHKQKLPRLRELQHRDKEQQQDKSMEQEIKSFCCDFIQKKEFPCVFAGTISQEYISKVLNNEFFEKLTMMIIDKYKITACTIERFTFKYSLIIRSNVFKNTRKTTYNVQLYNGDELLDEVEQSIKECSAFGV